MKRKALYLPLFIVLIAALLAAGCSGSQETAAHADLAMAPLHEMPAEVQQAPEVVRQAYQFAAANPEVLTQIPCYCGCGSMGHDSNYACYFSGEDAAGSLTFDSHALGCSICVDITVDTMRLLKEGKSVPEIRTFIDSTYAQYGPSNIPAD